MTVNRFVLVVLFSFVNPSFADELSNQITVGMTKAEVTVVMGATPNSEDCTTTLGVQKCNLTWKKGFWSKTSYAVVTVADRVISVSTQTTKLLGI